MLQLAQLTPFHFRMALAVLLGAAFLALQVAPKAASPLTPSPVCTENLNPNIAVMKPAKGSV
jgi:hypothetical protein